MLGQRALRGKAGCSVPGELTLSKNRFLGRVRVVQETLEVAVSRHFPEVSGSKVSGSVQLLVQCAAVRPHTLFGNIVYGNMGIFP